MNSDDDNNDEKYINITNRKIYFYHVNYLCGLQIEYETGIKEKESEDKIYDVDLSYEKITPKTKLRTKPPDATASGNKSPLPNCY